MASARCQMFAHGLEVLARVEGRRSCLPRHEEIPHHDVELLARGAEEHAPVLDDDAHARGLAQAAVGVREVAAGEGRDLSRELDGRDRCRSRVAQGGARGDPRRDADEADPPRPRVEEERQVPEARLLRRVREASQRVVVVPLDAAVVSLARVGDHCGDPVSACAPAQELLARRKRRDRQRSGIGGREDEEARRRGGEREPEVRAPWQCASFATFARRGAWGRACVAS